jgi:hypothetical protein
MGRVDECAGLNWPKRRLTHLRRSGSNRWIGLKLVVLDHIRYIYLYKLTRRVKVRASHEPVGLLRHVDITRQKWLGAWVHVGGAAGA